jgi:hypothetical protein
MAKVAEAVIAAVIAVALLVCDGVDGWADAQYSMLFRSMESADV